MTDLTNEQLSDDIKIIHIITRSGEHFVDLWLVHQLNYYDNIYYNIIMIIKLKNSDTSKMQNTLS